MADMFRLQLGQEDQARAMLFHDPAHPLAQLVIPTFEGLSDELLAAYIAAMAATAKVSWNPYLHDPRLEGLLGRIDSPTLLAWGGDDRLIPPAYGERLAELIEGSRLEIVPDCGHMVWFERPRELLELALGHLAGTPA
jgi:pimeloyl-ACP methyl ester carboxylesterase